LLSHISNWSRSSPTRETYAHECAAFQLGSHPAKMGWLLFLGILLVVLGTIAVFMIPAATLGTVLVLGWLLVVSGIIEMVHAFRMRRWGSLFLHLIGGVLGVLIGFFVVTQPVAGALAWTMLLASFLTVISLFRVIAAIALKFPNWGWAVFDGIITLGLGILVWANWPWSGLWFLGLAVGISLILRGWSYVMFALAIHSLAVPIEIRRAA
jgi:uncharacterized membrane protein HdeD (DUF308 family)